MAEDKETTSHAEHKREAEPVKTTPQEVIVRRTNPQGAMIAFIIAALFIGAVGGYFVGFIAARASDIYGGMNRRGYMMQSQQDSPWGSSFGPGVRDNQSDGSPSSSSSTNSI